MKPIKPRPLSKRLRKELERAAVLEQVRTLVGRDARAILAALKHEREQGRREGRASVCPGDS